MVSLISRQYCLAHPVAVTRLFGLDVFLGMLFSKRKSLLERVEEKFSYPRVPMPGQVGDAYRLSALFELRAARIYQRMAERFKDIAPTHQFFKDLQEEEEEHARVMNICLYAVKMGPSIRYVPSVRDPEIRREMQSMRELQRRVASMSLDEALRSTEELERGEVNIIFGKLLGQVEQPGARMLDEYIQKAEGHGESVPRRIQELRERLKELGLKSA